MIEYYTLMHKGGKEDYTDRIFLNYSDKITVLILNTSEALEKAKNDTEILRITETGKISGSIVNSSSDIPFEPLRDYLEEMLNDIDHVLLRIDDGMINVSRHGKVYVMIAKDGELKRLPNGKFGLDNGDMFVCGTYEFFKYLSNPAVLSDALISDSSEEWMDNMVCRISDQNMLSEGNLTAVTFIVRGEEEMKIYKNTLQDLP